jgi:two-component system response regulator PilR (NtrC family)
MKNGISILVADDEQLLRDLLVKILSKEGYQVETAVDGEEALEKLRQNRYSLLISDIKMPRLNGFELLKQVKQTYPEMGVIMMTAYGDSFSVKDSLLLGADEYITKPFKSFEIHLIVERAYWRLLSSQKGITAE